MWKSFSDRPLTKAWGHKSELHVHQFFHFNPWKLPTGLPKSDMLLKVVVQVLCTDVKTTFTLVETGMGGKTAHGEERTGKGYIVLSRQQHIATVNFQEEKRIMRRLSNPWIKQVYLQLSSLEGAEYPNSTAIKSPSCEWTVAVFWCTPRYPENTQSTTSLS